MAELADLVVRTVAYPVCWSILINGIDDIFIDVNYYVRGLFKREERQITVEDLKSAPQQRIALMVPAWQEEAVIRQMLELNLKHLDYSLDRYDIFVGCYSNDLATQREVDSVARRVENIHKVVVPHPGPTCKADALNWVYQAVLLLEEQRGEEYDILLMHDAEDIIHPLAMRLYNYLIPDHDFVQTPVFPLEQPWHALVACTYKDEFTEHHLKDMLVRESIGGLVPSAGVGSGFARQAFEDIALAHSQEAFNTSSLTEDYEIGMKFRLAEKKAYFACRAISRTRTRTKGIFRKRQVKETVDEYIATREFFPDSFKFAVKQRSRWVLGIAFQGWEQIGWQGPIPVLYCLWRDRKAIITNYMAVFAYMVALYAVARLVIGFAIGRPWTFDNLFPPGSVLWWVVMFNTLILAWRAVMKFIAVDKIYGPVHGLISIPRFFVSNTINFLATSKAIRQYVNHRITGEPLRWLKTDHVFPSVEELRSYQRRLGELLMDREGLKEEELEAALALQTLTMEMPGKDVRLGRVLKMTGMVSGRDLADALADQLSMDVVEPDPYSIPLSLLQQVPESTGEILGVLPLAFEDEESVLVAVSHPPNSEIRTRLDELLKKRVVFAFASEEALARARRRAYRRLLVDFGPGERPERLGEYLVRRGFVSPDQLDLALTEQTETGEPLGELLVRKGLVAPEVIGEALSLRRLGGFRAVVPADADTDGLAALGYGLCALYNMVPLLPDTSDGPTPIAAAFPLHDEVVALVRTMLGTDVQVYLAPAIDVRLALAGAARFAWPQGIAGGAWGTDGAELDAIRVDPGWTGDLDLLRRSCRIAGKSPIEYLLAAGRIGPEMAARLRARSIGLALAGQARLDEDEGNEWLPPGLALREDIQLVDIRPGMLVVAAPKPSPRLTRQVAALFPDVAIAWRVAPYGRTLIEAAHDVTVQKNPQTNTVVAT